MSSIRARVEIPVGKNQDQIAEFVSFHGLNDDKEHVALVFNQADKQKKAPLVRIHSECLTGDIFHSARCDCGKQLNEAIDSMSKAGGILLYLRQEGRGIGLYNKLDAYKLQDKGYDTYAANRELGFEDDMRDFSVAAQMLLALGITRINLMTNNPEKLAAMKRHNIEVDEHVETGVYANKHNEQYLKAKIEVGNHAIELSQAVSDILDEAS
ncbi:GTP cyclohydrolase II [Flocculibacter collagenilyticus]|uniref:GTP cyclohydrolase II n=1 Tax=Flocculibacter collagenilyticus TaxID=2744479 RepID=UPI0018F51DF0|nr:GTP cyclohydrolase II [Flocculibacter collagenilyticus]